jgi:hypothetical protein
MEKIAKNLQLILMCIILISTVIAVGIEIKNMFLNQSVTLADLLVNVSVFGSPCNGKGVLGSTID